MTRALIIGEEQRQAITDLVTLARLNPFDAAILQAASMTMTDIDLLRWRHKLDSFTMGLPIGFTVTYTHEEHPCGLCEHINISVDGGKYPSTAAIAMICQAFGMFGPDHAAQLVHTWPEQYEGRVSIHIVALYNRNPS